MRWGFCLAATKQIHPVEIRRTLLKIAGERSPSARSRTVAKIVKYDGFEILPDDTTKEGFEKSNLCHLSTAEGGPLPTLEFRNCHFAAILDLTASQFLSIEIIDCTGPGIHADGVHVHGNFVLKNFGARKPGDPCAARLSGARIDGTADFRVSKLKRDERHKRTKAAFAGAPKKGAAGGDLLRPGRYGDQFALSLDGASIGGRARLSNGFSAEGGVSLFQAHLNRDLLIEPKFIDAVNLGSEERSLPPRSLAALDAKGLVLRGNLAWRSPADATGEPGLPNVRGRVELVGARIDGDVVFQSIIWDEVAHGGIDARGISIGGQIKFGEACVIARRSRQTRGLRSTHNIGVALDCWKAHIDRGVLVDKGCRFLGPVQFNQSKLGRQFVFYGNVEIPDAAPAEKLPFHVALDMSDARLDGHVVIRSKHFAGRVTFERMQVDGAFEISRLPLDPQHCRTSPTKGGRSAASRILIDETSLLDLQDLTITGGLNIKRKAITFNAIADSPHLKNGIIVDLRGLTAASFDDADGTAWAGLKSNLKDQQRVKWRIRLDGIHFGRLDTSSQDRKADTSEDLYDRLFRTALLRDFDIERTHETLGHSELRKLRLAMLASFHDNRCHDFRRSAWMRRYSGPRWRWLRKIYRHTIDPSWFRRERMPAFRPQPYEMFAKGYALRGDVDIAIDVAERRLDLQWRKRMRDFGRKFSILYLPPVFAFQFWIYTGATAALAIAVAISSVPHLLPWLVRLLLKWGFGFGLRSRRALITPALTVAFISVTTPCTLEHMCDKNGMTTSDWSVHLLYGVDKLFPGIDSKEIEYVSANTATVQAANHEAKHFTASRWFPFLDIFWEIFGLLITTATVFTLSGLARRDVERGPA